METESCRTATALSMGAVALSAAEEDQHLASARLGLRLIASNPEAEDQAGYRAHHHLRVR
jgi:hypothetical protein